VCIPDATMLTALSMPTVRVLSMVKAKTKIRRDALPNRQTPRSATRVCL